MSSQCEKVKVPGIRGQARLRGVCFPASLSRRWTCGEAAGVSPSRVQIRGGTGFLTPGRPVNPCGRGRVGARGRSCPRRRGEERRGRCAPACITSEPRAQARGPVSSPTARSEPGGPHGEAPRGCWCAGCVPGDSDLCPEPPPTSPWALPAALLSSTCCLSFSQRPVKAGGSSGP